MYKIIGADQKQYGPISGEQIRQWISEGRVNGQTIACAEGSEEWKPIAEFPEFGFTANPPTFGSTPNTAPLTEEEILARDYSLDIADCVAKSWAIVKGDFWPIVGITFLVCLSMNGINQLIGLISRPSFNAMIETQQFSASATALFLGTTIITMPIASVFMGGLFRYYLKLIRGQEATIADAFSGFTDGCAQLAILGLVQGILVFIGVLLCFIPGIYLAVAWYFSTFLIVDRGMNFWSAMELSRKMVSKHWFMVFGIVLVMGLLAAAGLIACCVGIIVSMPVAFIALTIVYETIFGRKNA
jgi:hypothetical protein